MASKLNFGKRLRVTGHEYRKMDYGAALRCGCSSDAEPEPEPEPEPPEPTHFGRSRSRRNGLLGAGAGAGAVKNGAAPAPKMTIVENNGMLTAK